MSQYLTTPERQAFVNQVLGLSPELVNPIHPIKRMGPVRETTPEIIAGVEAFLKANTKQYIPPWERTLWKDSGHGS